MPMVTMNCNEILIKCQACPTTTNWKVTLPNRSKLWNNIKEYKTFGENVSKGGYEASNID